MAGCSDIDPRRVPTRAAVRPSTSAGRIALVAASCAAVLAACHAPDGDSERSPRDSGIRDSGSSDQNLPPLPDWLPEAPQIEGSAQGLAGGDYVIGASYSDPPFVFAATRQGDWLWARRLDTDRVAVQAQRDVSGAGVRTIAFDAGLEDPDGQGLLLGPGGDVLEQTSLTWAHHVFTQHDDGTVAWLALDVRDWTDPETGKAQPVVGDALWERSPDGSSRRITSTWDWLDVVPNDGWTFSMYPVGHDWTHANSVQYDPDRDTYLVGFYQLDAVAELDRATGLPLRWFTADPDGPTPDGAQVHVLDGAFHHPHDANLTADGNLLLVSTHDSTRAVEYSIGDGVLTEVWTWGEDLGEFSPVLGQARRLDGGDTLYLQSTDGILRQVAPDGSVPWSMSFNGLSIGQVQVVDAVPGGGLFAM